MRPADDGTIPAAAAVGSTIVDSAPEHLFHRSLDRVERAIAFVCRRNGLVGGEAEELRAHVLLKLVDDDYAVFRKFEGRSELSTYLVVVIGRLLLDWRTARWGKWRPSAAARRLGEPALSLERLLYREGLSYDEAVGMLRENHGVELSDEGFATLAAQIPARESRRFEGDETLGAVADPRGDPEVRLLANERREEHRQARSTLSRALGELPDEDRLLVRLRFEDGHTVADIARLLHRPQKPLYRRLEKVLRRLRGALRRLGLADDAARNLLAGGPWEEAR